MKKIGILTTYFASNYGAMLQPFALKRHLEMMGCEVEMIRYKQKTTYRFYNPWKPWVFRSLNIKRIISYLYYLPGLLKRNNTFNRFMWEHINPEKGFASRIPEDKDFYFIGSDQIWNYKVPEGFDDVYFGKFKTKDGAKKISYAASAEGLSYNSEQTAYIKKSIWNFDAVSVREKKLEKDIKRVTGREDVVTVLDPTMLVDPKVYDEVKHIHPCPGEKFIFFYDIRNCKLFAEKILDHARSLGARLVIVSEMPDKWYKSFARKHKEVIYEPYAGIELFLGGMKYAEWVYTASFHGSVFAILNHKKFYTLNLHDNKMTRPTYLLDILGLQNRLLSINDIISNDEIDYENADRLLNDQRTYSRNFILDVLK